MCALDPSPVTAAGVTIRWRPTPWDALGLGVAGTAELVAIDDGPAPALAQALAAVDRVVGAAGVALTTTRVAAEREAVRAALVAAGYLHVEASLALALDLVEVEPGPMSRRTVAIEVARPADAGELGGLVEAAFAFSRFHEDPRIHPSRSARRYRRWIADSLAGDDQVWIHRHRGVIAALMSFRRDGDHVQLYLGGTRPELGPVAPMFWAGVLGRLRDEGVRTVATRVSLANPPAVRLHQAFGFATVGRDACHTRIYDASTLATSGGGPAPAPPRTAERT